MPVLLFLDIDGVLHPADATAAQAMCFLPRLESVLRDFPDVELVIASDWRKHHELHELRAFFSPDIGARVVGVTPLDPSSQWEPGRRQRRVEEYLALHCRIGTPWVALDDEWDNYDADANLIRCDDGFGDAEDAALRAALARIVEASIPDTLRALD